jgi:transposase
MAKPRRKFSREYKLEAVRRVVNNGEPVTEVARAIGVQSQSLHGWVRAFKAEANEAFRGNGKLTAQDEEIRKLRRELARVQEERDILKKATVFFAREPR